jgi:hypothetical protein
VKGTWREGSLAGDSEGYLEKGSREGRLFSCGLRLENLEEGSSTEEFESWMKGLWGWGISLFLKRLRGAGLVEGSFTGKSKR